MAQRYDDDCAQVACPQFESRATFIVQGYARLRFGGAKRNETKRSERKRDMAKHSEKEQECYLLDSTDHGQRLWSNVSAEHCSEVAPHVEAVDDLVHESVLGWRVRGGGGLDWGGHRFGRRRFLHPLVVIRR